MVRPATRSVAQRNRDQLEWGADLRIGRLCGAAGKPIETLIVAGARADRAATGILGDAWPHPFLFAIQHVLSRFVLFWAVDPILGGWTLLVPYGAEGCLERNPNHPGLNSHEFTSLKGANGEKIFEAYAQDIRLGPIAFSGTAQTYSGETFH
jgi:hypothetical protein